MALQHHEKYHLKSFAVCVILLSIQSPKKGITEMKILESAENYLETILILHKRNGNVRSIDIANELDYTKPSVSIAMKHLREDGFIEMDRAGYITLCPSGMEIAEKIYERHTLLSKWLISLGVSPEIAAEDACRIEHVLSTETFDAIKKHAEAYQSAKNSNTK